MADTTQNYYETMMHAALDEARLAYTEKEVPIGAVICKDGKVIASGHNRRETMKNSLRHAEIEVINNACNTLGGWRLDGCDLFVTLEPCPMCSGAIINSRISRVIFGAKDKKAGCCESIINIFDLPFNHRPVIIPGVLEDECAAILKEFFTALRERR